MSDASQLLPTLKRHGIPFVIIGAHAVNFHGFGRATEDTDVIWLRFPESEQALFRALTELRAHYIGDEIDPQTGIERTHPVTLPFVKASHLMMLSTTHGFLDLFDYIPGFPNESVQTLFATSVESAGLKFTSIDWLRRMKRASDRPKDRIDLENLPE